MTPLLTVEQLLQVAAACHLLKPGNGLAARVSDDIPGIVPMHPIAVLAADGLDTAAALGRLTEFWSRLTGRTCFMSDLNQFPLIVGKRFEGEADRIEAGEECSEEELDLRRYGLLWSEGLEGEKKLTAAAAAAKYMGDHP